MVQRRLVQDRLVQAAGRRLDRWRGKPGLHFLHVGKTGGSLVRDSLAGARSPVYRVVSHGHGFSLDDLQGRDAPADRAFLFVRDPVSRFVSGFESRRRQGRPRYDIPWTPQEAAAFERWPTAGDLAEALAAADPAEAAAAAAACGVIGHLRMPLTYWLGDAERLRPRLDLVAFAGAQERLEQDFDRLCRTLHVHADLGGGAGAGGAASAHRSPERPPELSAAAAAAVRRHYAADYAVLALLRERFPELPDYAGPA